MEPIRIALDRSISVPSGKIIRTGYVDVFNVRLACRARMAIGDVDGALNKLLQLGDQSSWPCPNGYWEGTPFDSKFVILDGRHEYVASIMLGRTHILVAWLE